MPWELWAVVSIVAGIVIVLLGAFYIFSWRDIQVRRAPVLPQPAVPVVTPAPAPVAPAAPAEEDEDPERMLARTRIQEARDAVKELADASLQVSVARRRLQAEERLTEFSGIEAQRKAMAQDRIPPRVREIRREEATPARDEAPAPRQQPRRDADQRQSTTTRDLDVAYQRGVADRLAGATREVAREHAEWYPRQQGLQRAYWDGYGDRRNAAPATPQPTPAPAAQPAATAAPAQNAGAAAMAT